MTRRIFRYEIKVDNDWHEFKFGGDVLHVNSPGPEVVEFWTTNRGDDTDKAPRLLKVFGTGQTLEIPDGYQTVSYCGTTICPIHYPLSRSVWHLYEAEPKY